MVLVKTSLGMGSRRRQGSGVVVAPGLVATNAHVLQGGHDPVVTQGGTSWLVTQVRTDPGHDLSLLTVPGLPLPAAEPGPEDPVGGQVVFSLGYPEGQGPTKAPGRLLGNWHFGESRLLQSDAVTRHGSSGGGLFDAQGRLLGLTTFTFGENSSLNFSVPIRWVQELIARSSDAGSGSLVDLSSSDLLGELAQDPRNWPAWEQSARAWSEANPKDPDAWMALGLALDNLARRNATREDSSPLPLMREAVQCFERSVTLRKTSLRPQAQGWNALGAVLDTLNRFGEAELAFRQAVRLDEGFGQAWMGLGTTLLNGERFQESAKAFSRGLALEPDNSLAWTRYAFALRRSGDLEEAGRAYTIALRYRPLSDEVWWELGALRVTLQQLPEAEGILARLKERESPYVAKLDALLRKARAASKRATRPEKRTVGSKRQLMNP